MLYVPANCTGQLQPCDVGINRTFKHKMRAQCQAWLAKEVQRAVLAENPDLFEVSGVCGVWACGRATYSGAGRFDSMHAAKYMTSYRVRPRLTSVHGYHDTRTLRGRTWRARDEPDLWPDNV